MLQNPTVLCHLRQVKAERSRDRETSPLEVQPTNPVTKQPGRRNKIKLPKANDQGAWQNLDADLSQLLELALKGRVESKLNIIRDIIFKVCREKFGEVRSRKPTAPKERKEREGD